MNSHRIAASLVVITAACLSSVIGCVGATESNEEAVQAAPESLEAATCVTIQRGAAGAVADAKIRSDLSNINFGGLATFVTGDQFANRFSLLRFDLGGIPAGQDIVSAKVTLHENSNLGASTIDVHAATAPWSEGSVTWQNFGAAFAPAVAASFENGGAGHTGAVSFDATALTRSWYADAAANNGMALLADTNSTWASSESANASARPAMEVCYRPSVAPVLTGALVQASDGGHWRAYDTSSCGSFHLYILDGADPVGSAIQNAPDGTINLPLSDGTHTVGLLGTDGNGANTTRYLDLDFGGTVLTIDDTGNSATAIIGSKLVTVSGFQFKIPTASGYSPLDRVAVCGVFPDNFVDSYGSVTVTVTPAP